MVGHQSYLTNIICDMIFQKRVNQVGQINLKKAGLAKLRVISLIPNTSGKLRWLLTPRILKSLAKDGSKAKSSAAYKKMQKVTASNKARRTKDTACYYNQGFKRCVECEIFVEWVGMRCPCCDRILRIKPHNNVSKGKLLQGLNYI